MGEWIIDPHFLDLGTSWRWVVSVTPLTLYPGKEPPVPILYEVGWTSEPVWTIWRSKNFPPTGTRTPAPHGRPARSQSLYQLSYPDSRIQGRRWNFKHLYYLLLIFVTYPPFFNFNLGGGGERFRDYIESVKFPGMQPTSSQYTMHYIGLIPT
jgi:hypothetical protein